MLAGSPKHKSGHVSFGHPRWTRWTVTEAAATGQIWENDCLPDRADGHYQHLPVTVLLSRPLHELFTRMRIHTVNGTHSFKLKVVLRTAYRNDITG